MLQFSWHKVNQLVQHQVQYNWEALYGTWPSPRKDVSVRPSLDLRVKSFYPAGKYVKPIIFTLTKAVEINP